MGLMWCFLELSYPIWSNKTHHRSNTCGRYTRCHLINQYSEFLQVLVRQSYHLKWLFVIAAVQLSSSPSCDNRADFFLYLPSEPAQNSVKYLTWHRTTSSRSSSSRNLLGANLKDDSENLAGNLFDNFCMISGSHASTLDRLYAWERKLYDEVKVLLMNLTVVTAFMVSVIAYCCGLFQSLTFNEHKTYL